MYNREHPTCGSNHSRTVVGPSPSTALLLCNEKPSLDERNLTTLLDFFGIPWKTVSPSQVAEFMSRQSETADRFCILSSASCFASAVQVIPDSEAVLPSWILNAISVFIYCFQVTP